MKLFGSSKPATKLELQLPAQREDPTGLAPFVTRLREWVAATRCFPTLERDRGSIESLLQQIADRQATLAQPLRILLLGGTGVGKSTLFNALAGTDLAKAASVRPTTRDLTVYFHAQDGTAALGDLESRAKLTSHERPALKDKIVIDAPDFDSTAQENRALLVEALQVTDLALCVVTSEKYLSGELFQLLEQYRDGIEYVFVLNKAELAEGGKLVADDLRGELERHGILGARILCVSALAVRQAQRQAEAAKAGHVLEVALPPQAGQWGELRDLLEKELDRVRIREIKAAKLADRVRGALARIEEHVPSDAPEKVEAWRAAWQATLKDLSADLSRLFFGAIHDDFELRNILRYLFGTAFGGIFGVFMTLVYGLRSVLMPGFVRARRFTSPDLEALIGERLRAVEIAHIERRVTTVLERFEQEGRSLGFEPPAARAGLPAPAVEARATSKPVAATERRIAAASAPTGVEGGVAALVVAIRAEAARRFYDIFEETASGGSRFGRIAWNVLPVFVVLMTIYAFVTSLIPGLGGGDAVAESLRGTITLLEGSLVSILITCLLQWPFAERIIERRIRHSLELLEGVVDRSVQGCLGHALVREPERILMDVLERFRELERIREDGKRLLKDDASKSMRRPRPQSEMPAEEPVSAGGGREREDAQRTR